MEWIVLEVVQGAELLCVLGVLRVVGDIMNRRIYICIGGWIEERKRLNVVGIVR
jgi:hypothetical protein